MNVDQLHGFYFNHSFSLVCKDLEEGNDVKKAGYILEYLPAYSVLVASGLKLYQTPVNSPVLLMYINISNRLRYFRAIFLFLSNFLKCISLTLTQRQVRPTFFVTCEQPFSLIFRGTNPSV